MSQELKVAEQLIDLLTEERNKLRIQAAAAEKGLVEMMVLVMKAETERDEARRERDKARADEALCHIALENCTAIEVERDLLRAEVARRNEALEACVEAMDSADYFRTLALHASTADLCRTALDRAREVLKGGG